MKLSRLVLPEALLATLVWANTEKVIFTAPQPIIIPDARPTLLDLQLNTLSPSQPALRTLLPVAFPTQNSPQGSQHWYLLSGLAPGQRHELRVCWAATQPTKLGLETFDLTHVFDTPDLIQSLAAYTESKQPEAAIQSSDLDPVQPVQDTSTSVLFLRVQAAADFYTTNKTLMQQPPPVLVDLVLDPYLLNVFPRSLITTAIYIVAVAIASIYISGHFWKRIAPIKIGKAD